MSKQQRFQLKLQFWLYTSVLVVWFGGGVDFAFKSEKSAYSKVVKSCGETKISRKLPIEGRGNPGNRRAA